MPTRAATSTMSSGWRASAQVQPVPGTSTCTAGAMARMSRAVRAMACAASSTPRISTPALEDIGARAHPRRQVGEDAHDLRALVLGQPHDVVVHLHRRHRLDEEARPGARRAVDDPRHLPAVLGLQQQDVAVVAHGDDLVLQDALGVLALAGTTPSPTAAATSAARGRAAPRPASATRRPRLRRWGGPRGGWRRRREWRRGRPPPGATARARRSPAPRGGRSRSRPR